MEPMKGIEPPTPSLPWKCSTPELHWLEKWPFAIFAEAGQSPFPFKWSGRRDSNPRPSAWKADALPTELRPRTNWCGGDRIRTYSGIANRFTVCPVSPTSAHPQIQYVNSLRLLSSTALAITEPVERLPASAG